MIEKDKKLGYALLGVGGIGLLIYYLMRKKEAPPGVITFHVYLTNFPLEFQSQYPGWYVKWQGVEIGVHTPWYHRITITTDIDTGPLTVYPEGRISPVFTFGDGCSYYFNWLEETLYMI